MNGSPPEHEIHTIKTPDNPVRLLGYGDTQPTPEVFPTTPTPDVEVPFLPPEMIQGILDQRREVERLPDSPGEVPEPGRGKVVWPPPKPN